MNKKPTIKTLAELAGVSHVTVSKALRDCSDISVETKEKIKRIAKEIGYTPNANARNLSLKRAHTIGMIVPAMGNDTAYNDVFNSISAAAAEKGLSVVLGSCNRSTELEKTFCRNMCENQVGAIIISPISSDVSHIKEICRDTVPLIFLGGKVELEEKNYITMDYEYSAKLVVEHLFSLGHKDIALFLYHPNNRTITQKLEGYSKTMIEKGLKPMVYWNGDASDTYTAGKQLALNLIEKHQLPTAIWCASDIMALGVMDALQISNILVPEQVSVVGHDNLFFTEFDSISLTTITMPKDKIGIKAVEMVYEMMNQNNEYNKDVEYRAIFKGELVSRKSTDSVNKRTFKK